jgi:hypothetical protein
MGSSTFVKVSAVGAHPRAAEQPFRPSHGAVGQPAAARPGPNEPAEPRAIGDLFPFHARAVCEALALTWPRISDISPPWKSSRSAPLCFALSAFCGFWRTQQIAYEQAPCRQALTFQFAV